MGKCDIIVFAPHPDDEAFGCAHMIYKAVQKKKMVKVVVVANGESSVDGTQRFYGRKPKTQDFIDIGYIRKKESIFAMKVLGLASEDLIFLGYPNDGLLEILSSDAYSMEKPYKSEFTNFDRVMYDDSFHIGAPFCRKSIADDIRDIFQEFKPRYVYVTHPLDSHFDHRACGQLVSRIAKDFHGNIRVLYYVISKSKIPSPKRRRIYRWTGQLREKHLNEDSVRIKKQCINEYKSQSYLFNQLAHHYEIERFWKMDLGLRAKIAKKLIPSLKY
jgi:LmbE family N-acetylglucosaminyl deacetylase